MARRFALVILALALTGVTAAAQARGAQAPAAPPTPRAQAPIDLTGYWVAIISEDWRWRMITPSRGDFPSIPINLAAQKIAEAWDPAKDEAAGEACKAYGAPGLMRGPTRLHITWLDDDTLKMETDYGMQTRLFEFRAPPGNPAPSLQGRSIAQWIRAGGGRGRGGARFGAMKSVTTSLRPGYLRKNGVPYSEEASITEYIHRLPTHPNGDDWLNVVTIVEDPRYLSQPFYTSTNFRLEPSDASFAPTPCATPPPLPVKD
jgi:hypothetical protein